MRRALLALLAALPAQAQTPPPIQGQTLPAIPPPSAPATPDRPPVAAPLPSVTPAGPEWLPMGTVELRALDKTTARVATLTLKKGETQRFGALTITLRNCVARPADRPADSAAFLEITDANAGPGFRGWMLVSTPALAMLEHPGYDIRPTACRP